MNFKASDAITPRDFQEGLRRAARTPGLDIPPTAREVLRVAVMVQNGRHPRIYLGLRKVARYTAIHYRHCSRSRLYLEDRGWLIRERTGGEKIRVRGRGVGRASAFLPGPRLLALLAVPRVLAGKREARELHDSLYSHAEQRRRALARSRPPADATGEVLVAELVDQVLPNGPPPSVRRQIEEMLARQKAKRMQDLQDPE